MNLRRQRQAALYEEMMGAEALGRQFVSPERKVVREPDECNCGWKGVRARSFGTHHSTTCPRFES